MKYVIKRLGRSDNPEIPITESEYTEIKIAKTNLLNILGIEEKAHLMLANFEELEGAIHQLTVQYLVYSRGDWSSSVDSMQLINRRLTNLLSSCRMYTDQCDRDIKKMFGKESAIAKWFQKSLAQEYDGHFGFRVMETLRNYAQHRRLPIEAIEYSSSVMDRDPLLIRHICTPGVNIEQLQEQGGIKPQIMNEVLAGQKKDAFGNKISTIDIKPLFREYVGCLINVHCELRRRLIETVKDWDTTIFEQRNRYQTETDDSNTVGLGIAAQTEDDRLQDQVYLADDFISRRRTLEELLTKQPKLQQHYVSCETEADSKRIFGPDDIKHDV